MEHAAVGLAGLGLVVGILFQLRGLLSIVPLLFIASIAFAITHEYGFLKTVFTVFAAQTIFQLSYFMGLVILAIFNRHFGPGTPAAAQSSVDGDRRSAPVPLTVFGIPNRTRRSPHLFARGIAQDR
jgi:hypothetical protein